MVADCAIYSTALDIADAANALAAERHPVDPQGLATITPYVAGMIRRFGDRVLNLIPSDSGAATCLDPNPALRSRPARVAAVFACVPCCRSVEVFASLSDCAGVAQLAEALDRRAQHVARGEEPCRGAGIADTGRGAGEDQIAGEQLADA